MGSAGKVRINFCNFSELMSVRGVGRKTASLIKDLRDRYGNLTPEILCMSEIRGASQLVHQFDYTPYPLAVDGAEGMAEGEGLAHGLTPTRAQESSDMAMQERIEMERARGLCLAQGLTMDQLMSGVEPASRRITAEKVDAEPPSASFRASAKWDQPMKYEAEERGPFAYNYQGEGTGKQRAADTYKTEPQWPTYQRGYQTPECHSLWMQRQRNSHIEIYS